MIKLTKSDVIDFARIAVLANTPISLFKGMVGCAGMHKLRQYSVHDLVDYYDRVTARAERSEIVVGLAYAVLCSIALHARDHGGIQIDASRLSWGRRIWDFAVRAAIRTDLIVPALSVQQPKVIARSSASVETPFLFGPNGRPLQPSGDQG